MTTRRIDACCSVARGAKVAPMAAATAATMLVPDLAGQGVVAGPPAGSTS